MTDPNDAHTSASHEPRPDPDPGHDPPSAPDSHTGPIGAPAPTTNVGLERGFVIGQTMRSLAEWSLRLILITVAVGGVLWIISKVWEGILPIFFALLLASLLWPVVRPLVDRGVPPALASLGAILVTIAAVVGVMIAIAPSVMSQASELVGQAAEGVRKLRDWSSGPPLNIENDRLDDLTNEAQQWLQDRSASIASGVFTGVTTVGSVVLTMLLVVVLTFFFLKDGRRFLPWVRRVSGRRAGQHLTELFTRIWSTLSGFLRVQMLVSAVDAILIGIGLAIMGIPLWPALTILTFFGGLIPIVGAVAVGALAVLVALVAQGFTSALIVLIIILAVQQIEGQVLQPFLQSRTMEMHPAIILLAVAGAGSMFGIIGAFFAVPVAATVVVILRYISEQIDLRTGDVRADELAVSTPEGAVVAAHGQRAGEEMRQRKEAADRADASEDEDETDLIPPSERGVAGLLRAVRLRRRARPEDGSDDPTEEG